MIVKMKHTNETNVENISRCVKYLLRKIFGQEKLASMPLVLVIECPKHTQNKESNIFLVTRY